MDDFLKDLARGKKEPKGSSSKAKASKRGTARTSSSTASAKAPRELPSSLTNQQLASALLLGTGLFDPKYYLATYPDIAEAKIDPFEHFFMFGFSEGRRPNPIFDPTWYLATNTDVRDSGQQPLLHYASHGEREGRRPSPYFDPKWYRKKYNVPQNVNALSHYLKHRFGPYSPIPEFDAEYYLQTYKDVAAAKADPFEHFLHFGFREGRNPSTEFNTRFYIQRYFRGKADSNPLIHYLEHRHEAGIFPRPPENDATIPAEIKRFTKPSPHFEDYRPLHGSTKRRAKVLAFYLTQFHAFPENDRWWGKGFTEWTNIARGVPRFKDHYQPRVPRDLGFYSLDDVETIRRQVDLAKGAGIGGFVFYYYWFNKKRLLEKPLDQFLEARDIDMPFCLMWANENWTRRWDGMESEVLISQDYISDDDEELVADFARHFADPRYIRIGGRPLLMIYRPRLIPDAENVIARWRSLFAERYSENPIIVMSQSFDDYDPRAFGLDGALEFPPHKITKEIPQINGEVEYLDDTFAGQVFKYDDTAKYSLDEPLPAYPLIKTVVPSWDNDARRQGGGLVLQGSTPAKYEAWLSGLIDQARRNPFFGEPVVCINAWNEWCEGAYLEPDLHYGSAYLNATGRAIAGLRGDYSRPRLLLVGHDAFPSGAQQLLLNIGRVLRSAFGVDVEFLLMAGGALEPEYANVGPTTILTDFGALDVIARQLRERGFTAAIANTTATGQVVAKLVDNDIRTLLLVHELPRLLLEKNLAISAHAGIKSASQVVFASNFGRDRVLGALKMEASEKIIVRPQGSYKRITRSSSDGAALRERLGIGDDERMVLGVGYADMRKGFDLFLQAWRLLSASGTKVHFCWLGGMDPTLKQWLDPEIASAVATGTFHLCEFQKDVSAFYSAADAFVLTSREDPFPTVVLEALGVGVPVITFDQNGGIPEFLRQKDLGMVVPYCDVPSLVVELKRLFVNGADEIRRERAQDTVESHFAFEPYVRDLLQFAVPDLSSVSVVVPNYNYAHCLVERLSTIFDQSYPVEEIIVLDDASSDNSVEVIQQVADDRERDISLIINEENSGSVFEQWAKAVDMANGEFIWIAEADDLSEPSFLSSLLAPMRADPDVVMAFCDSQSIDADGAPVYASYKPYFATIEPDALSRSEVFDGREFLSRYLSVKNLILNVSSVVWRREALSRALDTCRKDLTQFRMAGDWRVYFECLFPQGARIAYIGDPLNVHRRHAASVTHSLKARQHVSEISRMHEIARARLTLQKSLHAKQKVYLKEVRGQLLSHSRKTNPVSTTARKRRVFSRAMKGS